MSVGAMARVVLGAWVLSGAWALIGTAAIPAVIPLPPEWVEVVRFDLPALLFLFCPGMLTVLALSDEAASRGGAWAGYRWLMARPTLVVPLAAGLILAASLLVTNPQAWVFVGVHDELWGIASGLLLGLFLRGGRVVSRLSVVLAPVGLVSYGIYLWHWPLVLLLQQHQDSLPARGTPYAWLLGPVALAAMTAPLAILSWFLLERPLLRAAAGRTARREPVTGRP